MRAWFTSNHDENSWNGTEYDKYGSMAKALAVFSATWNGVPLLYSGQELPNRKKLEFFEKDVIGWTGKNELHDFYKTLLNLHSTHPAVRGGDANVSTYRLQAPDNENMLAFLRKNGDKEVLVLLNLSASPLNYEITDRHITGSFKNVFTGDVKNFSNDRKLQMQEWEYLVFEK
jgi:glycosidase